MESEGKAWRCTVCGYLHYGDAPPMECPVCSASADAFELINATAQTTANDSRAQTLIIVGAGIAGLSAAEAARDTAPDAKIILFSAEAERPYYRLNLTRFLAGEIADDALPIHPLDWYESNRIELKLLTAVDKILPNEKVVELGHGLKVEYDKLIVTTGAAPLIPPIAGNQLPHVFTLRTAEDAKIILAKVRPGMKVVGIGGGILGLENAGALARRGATVTVVEAFRHLMPQQLNPAGSEVLANHLNTLGIRVLEGAEVAQIDEGAVWLKDGQQVPAEMVVITAGVRSNTGLLKSAGLPVNKGVLVDNFMRTSNPDILAAGDVCEHDGVMYGSWAAAQYQGRISGMNAAGTAAEFGGIPRSHTLKVLGKGLFSIGQIQEPDGSYRRVEDYPGGNYRMFMIHDGILVGTLLIGDLSLATPVRKAIEARTRLGSLGTAQQIAEAIKLD